MFFFSFSNGPKQRFTSASSRVKSPCLMGNPEEKLATGPRSDFIRLKTCKFEKFCPIGNWSFLENHIRPPHLYSEVLIPRDFPRNDQFSALAITCESPDRKSSQILGASPFLGMTYFSQAITVLSLLIVLYLSLRVDLHNALFWHSFKRDEPPTLNSPSPPSVYCSIVVAEPEQGAPLMDTSESVACYGGSDTSSSGD